MNKTLGPIVDGIRRVENGYVLNHPYHSERVFEREADLVVYLAGLLVRDAFDSKPDPRAVLGLLQQAVREIEPTAIEAGEMT